MKTRKDSSYLLFAGSSHEELALKIASELGVSLGKIHKETFPDGEIGIQILEDVRGKDVFLLQSLALRPNHYLMELLMMADALKRSSARTVSAVLPYLAYSRQDRKDKPHVPITAKLVASLLEKAGVTRIFTMDLHTEQIEGFFDIPVEHLHAKTLFVERLKGQKDLIVVSPDVGSNKRAREFAEDLGVDFAVVDKHRLDPTHVVSDAFIGDVKGKNVVLVDDICSTGVTLKMAALACRQRGAKSVVAVVTHGLFVQEDGLRLSGIDRVYLTDTVPIGARSGIEQEVLGTAQLFAQAISYFIDD